MIITARCSNCGNALSLTISKSFSTPEKCPICSNTGTYKWKIGRANRKIDPSKPLTEKGAQELREKLAEQKKNINAAPPADKE